MMYRHSVTVYDARTLKLVQDDLGRREPPVARVSELPGNEPRRSGRGGVLPRRPLCVRVELFDVRAALRGGGERQLRTFVRLPRQLRLPNRHGAPEDRRGLQGRGGAEGRGRDSRQPVRPRLKLVHVGSECHLDAEGTRGQAHRDRRVSAAGSRFLRRGTRPTSPSWASSELVRVDLETWRTSSFPVGAGPRAAEFHPSDRYIFVSLNAEGRVAKLDLRTGSVRAKVATGSAPRSLALAEDGRALVRRQLRERDDHEAPHLRHEAAADDRRLLPPHRHHVRPADKTRVGGLLHGHDPRLRRR